MLRNIQPGFVVITCYFRRSSIIFVDFAEMYGRSSRKGSHKGMDQRYFKSRKPLLRLVNMISLSVNITPN